MNNRVENWDVLLTKYFAQCGQTPFAWGTHDCVQFAAGWAEIATGKRPPLPVYDGMPAALRTLADMGGLEKAVTDTIGPPMANKKEAHRGDIALVRTETNGDELMGVIDGPRVRCPHVKMGLIVLPRSWIICAWSV